MNKEEIIRMAREAGCLGPGEGGDPNGLWEPHGEENITELMFRFAHLVYESVFRDANIAASRTILDAAVLEERERCCKIIYSMAGSDNVAQRTVDAIRRNP